jgi:uncharacterized protein (DUF1015 family)
LIFDYQQFTTKEILSRAKEFFQVEEVEGRAELEKSLARSGKASGVIGFVSSEGHYLLSLTNPDVMTELAPDRVQAWRELDVSILHSLLLSKIMEVDQEKIDNLENIKYLREPDMGYEEVTATETSFLFILNPTRIEQVTACTDVGEKMPQKSTDFYPKIVTGFAMLPVQVQEKL